MSLRNDRQRWGAMAMFFHWIMVLGILGNGVWGLLMTGMKPSMSKINVYALHKSIGLTVLALWLLRLLWRLADRPPPNEPAPRWQHIMAAISHALMYMLVAAIPLSGWWFNSLSGYPLQWFKLFNLPALAGKHEPLAKLALDAHEYLFWLLIAVLIVHVGAALKHHFADNDDVLRRMLPFVRLRNGSTSEGDHR